MDAIKTALRETGHEGASWLITQSTLAVHPSGPVNGDLAVSYEVLTMTA
jgi:hypothetical protein